MRAKLERDIAGVKGALTIQRNRRALGHGPKMPLDTSSDTKVQQHLCFVNNIYCAVSAKKILAAKQHGSKKAGFSDYFLVCGSSGCK